MAASLDFRALGESRAVNTLHDNQVAGRTTTAPFFLAIAGVLGGCHPESQLPRVAEGGPPATVTAPQASERYCATSAAILLMQQVDLRFRTSGYVNRSEQVQERGRSPILGQVTTLKGAILATFAWRYEESGCARRSPIDQLCNSTPRPIRLRSSEGPISNAKSLPTLL